MYAHELVTVDFHNGVIIWSHPDPRLRAMRRTGACLSWPELEPRALIVQLTSPPWLDPRFEVWGFAWPDFATPAHHDKINWSRWALSVPLTFQVSLGVFSCIARSCICFGSLDVASIHTSHNTCEALQKKGTLCYGCECFEYCVMPVCARMLCHDYVIDHYTLPVFEYCVLRILCAWILCACVLHFTGFIPSYLMCVINSIFNALEAALEIMNLYGFVQVAVTGTGFVASSKRAILFLEYKGLDSHDTVCKHSQYASTVFKHTQYSSTHSIMTQQYHDTVFKHSHGIVFKHTQYASTVCKHTQPRGSIQSQSKKPHLTYYRADCDPHWVDPLKAADARKSLSCHALWVRGHRILWVRLSREPRRTRSQQPCLRWCNSRWAASAGEPIISDASNAFIRMRLISTI